MRLVLPACARKLALQRRVGHHGYRRRHVQGVVVGNRLNVAKMVTEVSVGPFGQAVRLHADQRTICSDNIAFHTSRISLELCQLIWSENSSNRSTISVFAVHIPRSLGAGGAFFGPVISSVDTNGTHQKVRCTRAEDLGMVTMDLSGICGWSPTRARTRLGRGVLVSPNSSMATQFGSPWRGASGPLHTHGCSGDGHHRSLWHLRVVANPRTHAVGAGWTCVAQ